MNKKTILTLAVLLLMAAARMEAQVFIMTDDEFKYAKRGLQCNELPIIPTLDVTYDQYAPLSEGTLLLVFLGSAYLCSKRRKKK